VPQDLVTIRAELGDGIDRGRAQQRSQTGQASRVGGLNRSQRYPELVGDLTLHGVTRSITINAKKVGEGKDPWGGYRVGFKGKTEFRMKDFGMNYDLGPASEVVYLDLHIEGVKQ
jgi:hypothetical protein